MPEFVTVGETMAVMVPKETGKLRYITEYQCRVAGAESNTAAGIRKLGHTAGWISRIGEDELGEKVLYAIRAEGVDTKHVRRIPERRTGVMFKELREAQETRVSYYRENSAASSLEIADMPREYLKSAKILHLTGILPMLSPSCAGLTEWLFHFAGENRIAVSFDPNIRKKLLRREEHLPILKRCIMNADMVLLGREEAELILGAGRAEEICSFLLGQGKASFVAVKEGAEGAVVADRTGIYKIEPQSCRTVDTVGAGDAFNAAFLCGLLEGEPVRRCGKMGAIAGAMAVQTRGDMEGLPDRRELENFLKPTEEVTR